MISDQSREEHAINFKISTRKPSLMSFEDARDKNVIEAPNTIGACRKNEFTNELKQYEML